MSGFLGQYQTTMDNKGRFALPAKLRSVVDKNKICLLEGELTIAKGHEGCLSLYSEAEWESISVSVAQAVVTIKTLTTSTNTVMTRFRILGLKYFIFYFKFAGRAFFSFVFPL